MVTFSPSAACTNANPETSTPAAASINTFRIVGLPVKYKTASIHFNPKVLARSPRPSNSYSTSFAGQ
jgi:hypothetical protein